MTVYDKSRGLGSRMSTRRGPGWQCDHGAPSFGATDVEFREELHKWIDQGCAAIWPNSSALTATETDAGAGQQYVGTPRMNSPARSLAKGLHVRTSAQISELQFAANHWELKLAQQGLNEPIYDAAILAVPAP